MASHVAGKERVRCLSLRILFGVRLFTEHQNLVLSKHGNHNGQMLRLLALRVVVDTPESCCASSHSERWLLHKNQCETPGRRVTAGSVVFDPRFQHSITITQRPDRRALNVDINLNIGAPLPHLRKR